MLKTEMQFAVSTRQHSLNCICHVGVVNDAVVSVLYLAGQSRQAEFVVCITLTA